MGLPLNLLDPSLVYKNGNHSIAPANGKTLSVEKRLMLSNLKTPYPASIRRRSFSIISAAFLLAAPLLLAQAPSSRFVGTITAISGSTLSVKTDADGVRQIDVPS